MFSKQRKKSMELTSVDIVKKVKKMNSNIPDVTIRSNVLAMAPNHPFSGHWPSTRKLHGLFKYLGEGRFTLLEKHNKDITNMKDIKTEISEQVGKVKNLAELKKFTNKELQEYNGKNGKPTYVAYNGEVYDLSQSSLWSNGNHMGSHEAGKDMTEEVKLAPHGKEVLERDKVKHVGTLV